MRYQVYPETLPMGIEQVNEASTLADVRQSIVEDESCLTCLRGGIVNFTLLRGCTDGVFAQCKLACHFPSTVYLTLMPKRFP